MRWVSLWDVIRLPASDLPRDVHVLSAVAFLVAVGFGVMVPVLPVFARSFGVTQFAVGAVISAFALMRFLTSPLCGPINRLIGERVALGIGIGIVALSTAGAGLAQSYPQLLVLRGVGGIGSAMFSVSAMVLLLASVTAAQRGRASALYSGGFVLGGMAGPAIGGGLAAISIRAPFFFYAFTLVLAGGVGLAMLSKRTVRPDESGEHPEVSLREAWQQSRFRAACWANFASGWQAQGARSTLVPLLVVEVLNREAAWTGISFAIAAVVQAIALQPVGRLTDTWGRKPVLVVGLIACGVSSAFIPFSPNIGWLTVALCVFGAGSAALSTSPTAIVGDVTRGSGGTPVAVFQMHSDLGSIIGPLAAGALADHYPLPVAFGVGAVLMILASAWTASVRTKLPDDEGAVQ